MGEFRGIMPKPLAILLEEAAQLTDQELEEYEEWLPEPYANEFPLAKLSDAYIRLFALSWFKRKKSTERHTESRSLAKADKKRLSLERLAEGMRFSAQYSLAVDMVTGCLLFEHDLWRYGPLDSLWVRKGGHIVSSLIDSSVVDGPGDDPEEENGEDNEGEEEDDSSTPASSASGSKMHH